MDKFKSMLVQQTKDSATPTEIIPIATSTKERAAGDDRFIERAQVAKEYIDFLALVRSKHGPGSQIFKEICSEIAPLLKANVNGMVSQGTGGTGLPYQPWSQEAVETSLQSIGQSLGEVLVTITNAEDRTMATQTEARADLSATVPSLSADDLQSYCNVSASYDRNVEVASARPKAMTTSPKTLQEMRSWLDSVAPESTLASAEELEAILSVVNGNIHILSSLNAGERAKAIKKLTSATADAGEKSCIDASTNNVTLSEEESSGASLPSLASLLSIRDRCNDEWARRDLPPSREETQEHLANVERQLHKQLFSGAKNIEERLERLAEL